MNDEWANLKQLAAARKQLLSEALEIHMFIRDANETLDRIHEKDVVLSSDDYGQDVTSVEALLRKHDGVQRDLIAVGESIDAHVKESERLVAAYPDRVENVKAKKAEIVAAWVALKDKAAKRKKKLDDSLDLQRSLLDFRNSVSWINDMSALINAEDVAAIADVPAAEALLERHQERKDEISARQDSFEKIQAFASQLIDAAHYASDVLQAQIADLIAERKRLDELWVARNIEFDDCLAARNFERQADAGESWINAHAGFINSDEVGSSIDDVDALLRKLDTLEKTLAVRSEKAVAAAAQAPANKRM